MSTHRSATLAITTGDSLADVQGLFSFALKVLEDNAAAIGEQVIWDSLVVTTDRTEDQSFDGGGVIHSTFALGVRSITPKEVTA